MNRDRVSTEASRGTAHPSTGRPQKPLKVATSPTAAPAERAKKSAPLKGTTAARTGKGKDSTPALSGARRGGPSITSGTASCKAAAHESKTAHQPLSSTASTVDTTNNNINEGSMNASDAAAAATTSTSPAAATDSPRLAKKRSAPSHLSSSDSPAVSTGHAATASDKAPDMRNGVKSVSRKRSSKDAADEKTRTAGVKLPPLLREEQTSRLNGTLVKAAQSPTVSANLSRTLSPRHEAVLPHTRVLPPPIQHPSHNANERDSCGHANGKELLGPLLRSPRLSPGSSPNNSTFVLSRNGTLQELTRHTPSKGGSSQSIKTPCSTPLRQSVNNNGAASLLISTAAGVSVSTPLLHPTSADACVPPYSASERGSNIAEETEHITVAAALCLPAVRSSATDTLTDAVRTVNQTAEDLERDRAGEGTDKAALRSEEVPVHEGEERIKGGEDDEGGAAIEDGDEAGEDEDGNSFAASMDTSETSDEEDSDDDSDYDSDEEDSEEDSDDESESQSDPEDEDESSDDDSDEELRSSNRQGRRRRATLLKAGVAVRCGMGAAEAIRAKGEGAAPDEPKSAGGRRRLSMARGSSAASRSSAAPSASTAHSHHLGKKKKSKVSGEEPRRICTKISREGDVNVKVIYAVRTRHCFKRFVRDIMARFSFAKVSDFDLYCVDAAGDRVDIDMEEDFEQLLDAFEATTAKIREAQDTATRSLFSTAAGPADDQRTGHSANASLYERQGKPASLVTPGPPPAIRRHSIHNGTTAASSLASTVDHGGSLHRPSAGAGNDKGDGARMSTNTCSGQQLLSPHSHSMSSGFGATSIVLGGGVEDDGKSSASVLRLYVRYSNAYYVEYGIPEHMRSPSDAPSPYASPGSPTWATDPNAASIFTTQLQQLSATRTTSDEGPLSVNPLCPPLCGVSGKNLHNSDESFFSHTLLGSTMGSVPGSNALPLRHGSRGLVGGWPSHLVSGIGGTEGGGVGASTRSTRYVSTALEPLSSDSTPLTMMTETQHTTFSGTFMVDGSELVEWRQVSVLGRGSFGTVYEGITLDGKMIAVKVQELALDDDAAAVKALQMEIHLMRSLKHRNIVAYYGCQTRTAPSGGQQMEIFLELCHGGSLAMLRRKLMQTQHTFGISLVRSYTRQVLQGLAYLHAQHVVHRDIKSDNVLISATGEAKLADFGCSKRFCGDTVQSNPTTLPPSASGGNEAPASAPAAMYQTMVGSPFFMAPEVMQENESGYTSAADIWSVGCLVIELLGREPWEVTGTNIFQIMFRIAREERMPTGVPPNCPEMLHRFFKRCFERDPAKRATAAELLEHEWMTCSDKLLEEVPTEPKAK